MNKNRFYILIFALLSGLIAVLLTSYFNSADSSLTLKPVSKIDNLIFGKEVKSLDFTQQANTTYVASEEFDTNKSLCGLVANSENLYLPVEKDSTGLYSFNNVCNATTAGSYSLKIQAENLPVNIDYNKDTQKLEFYSPAHSVLFNNQPLTIARLNVRTESNIKSNTVLSICEKYYPLNEYDNSLQMNLGDLAKCNVEILTADSYRNIMLTSNPVLTLANWPYVGDQIEPLENSSREAVTNVDRNFSDNSVRIQSYKNGVFIAKEFAVNLEPFQQYNLVLNYETIKPGSSVKWGYRLITQQYKDDFQAKQEGQSTDKLTAYTNNNPYPTSETFIEQFVPNSNVGFINQVIQTKLDNIIGIQMFLFSDSRDSASEITYSNLQFYKANVSLNLNFDEIKKSFAETDGSITLANELKLTDGVNSFNYVKTSENLLTNQNYSFEKKMWDDSFSLEQNDCLPDHGGAIIGMALDKSDASEGQNSLILDAKTHYACSKHTFSANLQPNENYLVTFDYKNTNGGKISSKTKLIGDSKNIAVNENGDDSSSAKSQDVNPYPLTNVKSDIWSTFAMPLAIGSHNQCLTNISAFQLTLVSPSDSVTSVRNLFDNVALYKTSSEVFNLEGAYLYKTQTPVTIHAESETLMSNVVSQNHFATKFDLGAPAILVLDRAYSDKYVISDVNNTYHYKFNNLTNAWFVSPAGTYLLVDTGTGLIVTVRNVMLLISLALFVITVNFKMSLSVVAMLKKRVIQFAKYTTKLVKLSMRVIEKSNSFLTNRVIKPVIYKVLGTKDLHFTTLTDLYTRATNTLSVMFKQIFIDIVNKPIYILLIIIFALFVAKTSSLLYAPFAAIFLAWIIFKWDSRLLALAALLQLIVVPFLLIFKAEKYAEALAISVYFFLVMTVVMQIIEYWMDHKSHPKVSKKK